MKIETISDLQEFIHQSIYTIGGYWPPLSAVARMLEEIGELSYEIKHIEEDTGFVKYELADLFILSVCIANQYSAHLESEYEVQGIKIRKVEKSSDEPLEVGEQVSKALPILLDINIWASEIARVINAYEGSKIPKKGESLRTITESITLFQGALLEFAKFFEIDLLQTSKVVFSKKSKRDSKRFDTLYDPTLSSALNNFNQIKSNTHCVYAPQAKLWGASKFDESQDFDRNMFIILPQLIRFTRIAPAENIDGFIIEFPAQGFGDDINNLSKTMNKFLNYLNEHDPKESKCLNKDMNNKKWQFEFNGLTLFVIAFAPCYDASNPRYSSTGSVFLFVQPQIMFKKKIPRDKINGVKQMIREKFTENNQPYHGAIMDADIESYKFVKPLKHEDEAVKWWHSKEE